jgi:hypothetical protein
MQQFAHFVDWAATERRLGIVNGASLHMPNLWPGEQKLVASSRVPPLPTSADRRRRGRAQTYGQGSAIHPVLPENEKACILQAFLVAGAGFEPATFGL